tara:strand:+ start:152 stop:556 length:405 start_codon:yes stop_codon:yes gene_type:complete
MIVYSVNEKEEEQIERKRLGNPPEGYSPLEPMEDKLVHIICPDHGPFQMSWDNHLGDNKEKIAYGCPKCNRDWVLSELSLSRSDYRKLKTGATAFLATANERVQQLINEDYRENGESYEEHLNGRGEQEEAEDE